VEDVGEGIGEWICTSNVHTCMQMENWDMFKPSQEWGGGGIKENYGGGESNYEIL
jgi:hypothetical protein